MHPLFLLADRQGGRGQALNIIPELCTVEIEARAISGVRPEELLQAVRDEVEALADSGIDIEWTPLSAYPALFLSQDTSLVALLEQATGKPSRAAVSFGTEAGLFQGAGIDAIICGPGDIDRAHKANEFIELDELMACQRLIETLGRTCTG